MAAIPVPYIGTGNQSQTVLGHYAVAQTSGAIAATPASGDHVASIRWAPTLSNTFLVLQRLRIGYLVVSEITATVQTVFKASIARAFTADYTTASTAINLSTTQKTNQMRGNMSLSQMGANGPRICTTVTMSGQTLTADAAPFALAVLTPNGQGMVTGGKQSDPGAGSMMTAYEWTGLGQHPIVLSNNEGVIVQWNNAGHASGTINAYTVWEWAEVLLF